MIEKRPFPTQLFIKQKPKNMLGKYEFRWRQNLFNFHVNSVVLSNAIGICKYILERNGPFLSETAGNWAQNKLVAPIVVFSSCYIIKSDAWAKQYYIFGVAGGQCTHFFDKKELAVLEFWRSMLLVAHKIIPLYHLVRFLRKVAQTDTPSTQTKPK
jgi:hypothetical protein